jgi:hypothetical protein
LQQQIILYVLIIKITIQIFVYSVFWCDHQDCLRLITLREEQLPQKTINGVSYGLKLHNFVVENEKKEIVRAYVKLMIQQDITEERNPLLFKIARDNVIQNMKNDCELRKEIESMLNKLSKSHLLSIKI